MNWDFNWRRFLGFMAITVALAVLTVYDLDILPKYAVGPVVVLVFIGLLLISYGLPHRKPTLPRERMTGPRLWSLFAILGVGDGIAWVNLRFSQRPWLDYSLLVVWSVLAGLVVLRRVLPHR
jgi:peptidoglycan/LPS O-acetylase OafA/YrhL